MTTESRIREALEEAIAWAKACDSGDAGDTIARWESALSPPARRTSYGWIEDGIRYRVVYCGSCGWRMESFWGDSDEDWRGEDCDTAAAAIATLAGLTPEEPRVPSVRSELAKHELIDKVSPSGEEIERACRSSEPEEEA